ncbi:tail fiber domain-containing protein [Stieleria varia]|nr:tail fiber domain-containing protein [Stieleria varia]
MQIAIHQVPTGQEFGITSLSSANGLHNGGIGFQVDSALFPFFVFDTANEEALSVGGEGVGVGTYNANAPLHVYTNGFPFSEARVRVENDLGGPPVQREMFSLVNNGGSKFTFTDTNSGYRWLFATQNNGSFVCSRSGTNGNEFVITADGRVTMGPGPAINFNLAPNGNLQIAGTLTQSSDKNLKTAFASVDPMEVLDQVASMPIQSWQFKFDEPELRHLGPTAQDFHAAFGLGQDDKTIAPVDGIGVSLAAIQALNIEGIEKDKRINELKTDLAMCKRQLAQQQDQLKKLLSRLDNIENMQRKK